jgi:hypothetical protein
MNDVSINLCCIVIRNGVEIWLEHDRASNFIDHLEKQTNHRFIRLGNELINSADIVGIFTAPTMEEVTRRKNGQWKCKKGIWHERKQECECRSKEYISPIFVEEISEEQRQKNISALKEIREKYINAGMFKMS